MMENRDGGGKPGRTLISEREMALATSGNSGPSLQARLSM
jgi:hypothetical protein